MATVEDMLAADLRRLQKYRRQDGRRNELKGRGYRRDQQPAQVADAGPLGDVRGSRRADVRSAWEDFQPVLEGGWRQIR